MNTPPGPLGGITPPVSPTAAEVVDQLRQQNAQMSALGRMLDEMRVRMETGETDRDRLQAQAEAQRQQGLGRIQELRHQVAEATAKATKAEGELEYLVNAIAGLTSRITMGWRSQQESAS